MKPQILETAASLALGAAAIVVAATYVHAEFFAKTATNTQVNRISHFVKDWSTVSRAGIVIGDTGARVKIAEFADLECPFCARLDPSLQRILSKHPGDLALVFVHFPIAAHRFARSAARAVECADASARADAMIHAIYSKQDSLGFKSWGSFATQVGIRDTSLFVNCVASQETIPRIESGVALARALGVRGTPTLVVNGWMYGTLPSEEELARDVTALLAGRQPFASSASKER